ncbi:MAG: hypothetical protein KJ607_01755, partial [Bacteroidetes bacterium]|nr:hypothetical protein [Bacteroidota bacterium]
GINSRKYFDCLGSFLIWCENLELYRTCSQEFGDFSSIADMLSEAFGYYRYYFPDSQVPEVYTHISGFNQSVVVAENILSISIDRYLGADSKYYARMNIPVYLRKRMIREHIPYDCMYAWAYSEFSADMTSENLAANMICQGKMMYFLDAVFPGSPDSLKIGFTANEIEWCERNEDNMWLYLVENKLLFTEDYKEIKRYIDDAPFTATFSQDSPGRAGIWIGWQIVRSYMKSHPEITVTGLMNEQDYQKILNGSGYNP